MLALDQASRWIRRQGAPASVILAGSFVLAAVIFFFSQGTGVKLLALSDSPMYPWAFLTYPWAFPAQLGFGGLLFMVCLLSWMIRVGGAVENDMGVGRFLGFLALMTVLCGITTVVIPMAWHGSSTLFGPTVMLVTMTVLWATRSPDSPVSLFGFITVAAKWIAWFSVLGLFFTTGYGSPIVGLLSCLPFALPWALASNRLPIRYKPSMNEQTKTRFQIKNEQEFFSEVRKKEQEREERLRLKKLFEASMISDPEEKR